MLFGGIIGLVIGEDLIDAEGDVREEETALDDISATTADAPGAEEDGAGDGHADEDGVLAVDAGEGGDAPEEVDGAADDAAAEEEEADHPDVAAVRRVDEIARDLAGGLDDEQAAEAFGELEDGRGVSQQFIPAADEEVLHYTFPAEYPISHAGTLMERFGGVVEGSAHPARVVGTFHAELVQAPDQESGDEERLQCREGVDGPSSAGGGGGCCEAQAGEDEVVCGETEAEGEATRSAADVERERDGEDDAGEEGGALEDAEEHAGSVCGGGSALSLQAHSRPGVWVGQLRCVVPYFLPSTVLKGTWSASCREGTSISLLGWTPDRACSFHRPSHLPAVAG